MKQDKKKIARVSKELERRVKLWVSECVETFLPEKSAKIRREAKKEAFTRCMKVIDDYFAAAPKTKK
jgi:hypothetical protein